MTYEGISGVTLDCWLCELYGSLIYAVTGYELEK